MRAWLSVLISTAAATSLTSSRTDVARYQDLAPRKIPEFNLCTGRGAWVGRFCRWEDVPGPAALGFSREWFDLCWKTDMAHFSIDTIFKPTWDNARYRGLPAFGIHPRMLEPYLMRWYRLPYSPGHGMQMSHACPIGYKCVQALDLDRDASIFCKWERDSGRRNELYLIPHASGRGSRLTLDYTDLDPNTIWQYMTDMYFRRFTRDWLIFAGTTTNLPVNQRPGDPLILTADPRLMEMFNPREWEATTSAPRPEVRLVPEADLNHGCPSFAVTTFFDGVDALRRPITQLVKFMWGLLAICYFVIIIEDMLGMQIKKPWLH